jgi:hypothetical protein
MYINHDKKFIFVHVPKTAGSSIHIFFKDFFSVLDRSDPLPKLHHQSITSILRKYPDCTDYFKFAVTRNPYDRFLSGWRDFYQNRNRERSSHPNLLDDNSTFEKFCLEFTNSPWSEDIHFIPQYKLLTENGEIKVDKIIKFESLKNDLKEVFDLLDLPMENFNKQVKHRETYKQSKSYNEYYNDSTKKIVASFFKQDLELFNYEF